MAAAAELSLLPVLALALVVRPAPLPLPFAVPDPRLSGDKAFFVLFL